MMKGNWRGFAAAMTAPDFAALNPGYLLASRVAHVGEQRKEIEQDMRHDQRPQSSSTRIPTGEDQAGRHDEDDANDPLIEVANESDANTDIDSSPWTQALLERGHQISAKEQFLIDRIYNRHHDQNNRVDLAFDRVESPACVEHGA